MTVPYDPDALLDDLRRTTAALIRLRDSDSLERTRLIFEAAEELAWAFVRLDGELSKDGHYPQDWSYQPERHGYLPGPAAPEPF